MTLTLELDAEFAEVLAEEAARKKMSLPDYAVYLLMTTVPPPPPLKTGADVVAYWESEGSSAAGPTSPTRRRTPGRCGRSRTAAAGG